MTYLFNLPQPRQQFLDGNGQPLAEGYVYTYQVGTTIPLVTYQDYAGTQPNTNPINLDANGSCSIFAAGLFRLVVTDSDGNTLQDGVSNGGNVLPTGGGLLIPCSTSISAGTITLTGYGGYPVVQEYALGVSYVFNCPANLTGPFVVQDSTSGSSLGLAQLYDTPGTSNSTTLNVNQICEITYSPAVGGFVLLTPGVATVAATPVPELFVTQAGSSSVTGSWICPSGVTEALAFGQAPGGGGGACQGISGTSGGGGGGGAGQGLIASPVSLTPGTTYNYVVQAPGAGGSSGAGSNGGSVSLISSGGSTVLSLQGGFGGAYGTASRNAGGVTGGFGGWDGQQGVLLTLSAGGTPNYLSFGGTGGNSAFGPGGAGALGSGQSGRPGAFGGGGGGACGAGDLGGVGGPGFIDLRYGQTS